MSEFSPVKALKSSQVQQWHHEADVVVVGLGGAGVSAALTAANAGADVLVLEIAAAGGGTTALSGGLVYMGGDGGTPVQQACGYGDDSKEEMYNYIMACTGENADEAKVRCYVDNSLDHFKWLTENGVEFKPTFFETKAPQPLTDDGLMFTGNEMAYPFNEKCKPIARGHSPKVEGEAGGAFIMEKLIASLEKTSARIHYSARALSMITNDEGEVAGVVARIDGNAQNIRARKGVVLCAGGFIMNPAMVKKHAPKLSKANLPLGNPGDDGTGIMLGVSVGGAAINMHEGFVTLPYYPPETLIKGIIVNAQGQRFINEDCYHGRTGSYAMEQDKGRVYIICDEETFGYPDEFLGITLLDGAETLEELEKVIDVPEGSLVNTIGLYNKYAEQGIDPVFHKHKKFLKPLKPPYAAFDASLKAAGQGGALYPCFTLGGLDTLPTGEVVREDRTVIKGLYAAGRNTAGLPRTGAGYASGLSIADATFFGRQAGASAAAAEEVTL
ncbi:MAG: FAD-dependent oxidoreductase [Pseudomonadales bacterium]|nr:FAD-dependent oxidoreductase [Pseudomonadales bacterium]